MFANPLVALFRSCSRAHTLQLSSAAQPPCTRLPPPPKRPQPPHAPLQSRCSPARSSAERERGLGRSIRGRENSLPASPRRTLIPSTDAAVHPFHCPLSASTGDLWARFFFPVFCCFFLLLPSQREIIPSGTVACSLALSLAFSRSPIDDTSRRCSMFSIRVSV